MGLRDDCSARGFLTKLCMRYFCLVLLVIVVSQGLCLGDKLSCYHCICTGGSADEVNCSYKNLDKFPDFAKELMQAKTLNLNDNDLVVLPDRALGQFHRLINISISRNHIDDIHSGVFNATPDVTYSWVKRVDFSDNHLHAIPYCFQHLNHASTRLCNVTFLNLARNEIGPTLEEYSLSGVRMLEELNLSWNNIQRIEPRTLRYMENLKYLDISNNFIEAIPSSLFARLSTLVKFRLTSNKLSVIPEGMPETLEILEIGNNEIKNISKLHSDNLRKLSKMKSLNLSANGIQSIAPDTFVRMANISVLDLSNNALYQLQSDLFSGNPELEYIFLNGNRYLESLPSDIFINLRNLRYLFLYGCGLTTLEIGPPSVSPLSFDFISSDITSANVYVEKSYAPNLVAMWLFGNPINCNCQILPLVWFINNRNVTLDAEPNFLKSRQESDFVVEYLEKDITSKAPVPRTFCASPDNRHSAVVGKELLKVPEPNLICPNQPFYIAVSLFLGIALFTAAIPVVFFIVFIYLCTIRILTKHCGLSLSEDED